MSTWHVYFAERTPESNRMRLFWVEDGSTELFDLMDMSEVHQIAVWRLWSGEGTEDTARRAARCHWCFIDIGGERGHEIILKNLSPDSDPLQDLVVDMSAEQLTGVLSVRSGLSWNVQHAVERWAGLSELLNLMDPHPRVLIRTVGPCVDDPSLRRHAVEKVNALYAAHADIATAVGIDPDTVYRLIPRAARHHVDPDFFREKITEYTVAAAHLDNIPELASTLLPTWARPLIEPNTW